MSFGSGGRLHRMQLYYHPRSPYSHKVMIALVEKLAGQGTSTREAARRETAKGKPGRPKYFVFAFKPPTKSFDLRLSFKKSRVEKDEIISALENIIKELRASR